MASLRFKDKQLSGVTGLLSLDGQSDRPQSDRHNDGDDFATESINILHLWKDHSRETTALINNFNHLMVYGKEVEFKPGNEPILELSREAPINSNPLNYTGDNELN